MNKSHWKIALTATHKFYEYEQTALQLICDK